MPGWVEPLAGIGGGFLLGRLGAVVDDNRRRGRELQDSVVRLSVAMEGINSSLLEITDKISSLDEGLRKEIHETRDEIHETRKASERRIASLEGRIADQGVRIDLLMGMRQGDAIPVERCLHRITERSTENISNQEQDQ
jgi:chromosome segregation ATPase